MLNALLSLKQIYLVCCNLSHVMIGLPSIYVRYVRLGHYIIGQIPCERKLKSFCRIKGDEGQRLGQCFGRSDLRVTVVASMERH